MSTRNEHATARKQITLYVQQALLSAGIPSASIEWPNLRFKQPETGPWWRVTILFGESQPAALGPQKLNRTPFSVVVQVFMPTGTGVTASDTTADELGQWNNTTNKATDPASGTVAHVKFRVASAPVFVQAADGFEQYNVTLPGYFDIEPGSLV